MNSIVMLFLYLKFCYNIFYRIASDNSACVMDGYGLLYLIYNQIPSDFYTRLELDMLGVRSLCFLPVLHH